MKQIAYILEDFGMPSAEPLQADPSISEEEIENIRLEAFEKGYQAGWDDATKAARDEHGQIEAEFSRNLQDLSFTYHEAHSAVLSAVRPLLADVIDKIVPDIARETIGLRVKEQLEELAKRKSTQRVEIIAAPINAPQVEELAAQDFGFPLAVVPDETLSDGQVFLRLGDEETEIDLSEVTEGIRQAVEGFFTEQERKLDHG